MQARRPLRLRAGLLGCLLTCRRDGGRGGSWRERGELEGEGGEWKRRRRRADEEGGKGRNGGRDAHFVERGDKNTKKKVQRMLAAYKSLSSFYYPCGHCISSLHA